jgi:hypothetical protein
MGILDDLAMGIGLKERDRDYYDRTADTISRNQGSDAGDRYRSSISESYAAAPNYGTAIGPSLSDFRQVANPGRDPYTSGGRLRSDFQPGSLAQTYRDANLPQPGTFMHKLTNTPTLMGILARIISGYDAPPPQGELRSSYRPQRQQTPIIEPVAPITTPTAGSAVPVDMEALYSTSPSLTRPDVQLEVSTGDPSDPRYMPGGEFDAFLEMTVGFPDFDEIRGDRDLMMQVFEKYKAMHRGKN